MLYMQVAALANLIYSLNADNILKCSSKDMNRLLYAEAGK